MKSRFHPPTRAAHGIWLALSALFLTLPVFGETAPPATPVWRAREEVKPFTKAAPPKPHPTSLVESITPADVVRLEAPDLTTVLAEDAAAKGPGKGPKRIGIRRPLPTPIESAYAADGSPAWLELGNGQRLRVFTLESVEAVAVRIHFENLALPAGVSLLLFNADRPDEICGPYDAAFAGGRDEFWSESIFGSRVTVECLVPPGSDTAEARFQVKEIIHGYVPLARLAKPLADIAPKQAGPCNIDVTCSPDWVQTSRAVAGLGTIGGAGFLWCTGCLVADLDTNTFTDYFLTANHCVTNQTEANTLEFYWFYQTSSCNGAVPNLVTVPRTSGGADYLAGIGASTGNDFTFLRLRQDTPANVTYAGWSSASLTNSQPVIVIHHPEGDFKRISFGNQVGSDGDFWDVLWYDGTTEPGSSGAPLFSADHEIVGQLFGGGASCTTMTETDSFGRFDVTFPKVQGWLSGPPDRFAEALTLAGSSGVIGCSTVNATKEPGEPNHAGNAGGHSVWFRWTAPFSGPCRFDTRGSGFNTTLAIYTGGSVSNLTVIASNNDSGGVTSLVTFSASAGTTYSVAVDGYNGASGVVAKLNWFLGNDNFADAVILNGVAGDASASNVGATKEPGEPSHAGNVGGASVWYRWTAPAGGKVTFDTEGGSIDSLLAVYTGSAVGSLASVASNDDIDTANGIYTSRVQFTATTGRTYRIAVDGYNEGDGAHQGFVMLTWNQPPSGGSPPANNNFAAAQALSGAGGTAAGSNRLATKEAGEPNHAGTSGGQSVWYQWTAGTGGLVTIDTTGSSFDTVLAVYTGASVSTLTGVASNDDATNTTRTSQVTFTATAGTAYRIAVDGYRTQSGTVREGTVTLNWSQAIPPTPPELFDPRVLPDGQFRLTVNGTTGHTYAIEYSADLSVGGWSQLGTVTLSGATGTFTDTTTPGPSPRFYRARVVP